MFYKLLIAVFILFFATPAYCVAAEEVKNEEPTYSSLLERVKKFDQSVDFKALRLSYTETSDYNPYEFYHEEHKEMTEAIRNKQYEEAIKLAQARLDKNYMDIYAHLVSKAAYREIGDIGRSDFHHFVMNGLIKSILTSGDGKRPETAYLVIAVAEEYAILNMFGLRLQEQSLIGSDGHNYDMMEVINPETGETLVLYFNIDIPFSWLNKKVR